MKNIFVNMESGDGVMIFTENEKNNTRGSNGGIA